MTFEITIPVLNEEETLVRQIGILHRFLQQHFPNQHQWSIVIADNGSTDQTPQLGQQLEQQYPGQVKLLRVPKPGVGLALKTSWSQSSADIVGYMDLDLATDLKHFPQAYEKIASGNCQLVYGTRLHPQARVIGRSLKREISSRLFNFLLKIYLGVHFSDGMCGFKFLQREIFPQLYAGGAQNDGWFFSTELLTVAEWQNLNICELPITWTDDPHNSKVKIIPLARKYLKAMYRLKKGRPPR